MPTILFLASAESDGALAKPALEALSAAKSVADGLGAAFVAGIVGEQLQAAADAAAGAGATRVLVVCGSEFTQARYATDAAAAEALCKAAGADVVIAPGSSRWNRVLPGAAYRCGGNADVHVAKLAVVEGELRASRWYYRQRMEGVITRPQSPWFIAVDPGSQPAWAGAPATAAIESVAVALTDAHARTNVTGFHSPSSGEQTIRPEADLLFVAGAGWTKKQADGQTHTDKAAELILGFVTKAQASLGSSKSLVDLSTEGQAVLPFMSHLNQVGQTGATPRHPKGLSTCCHGEEPHVVGWRFVNERRAVNLDANCGWAQGKTDVLYVADAFEVMEKVIALLR